MFSGLIECTGKLVNKIYKNNDISLEIEVLDLDDFNTTKIGDSIAVNGVCLTVVELKNNSFTADISSETLNKTNLAELNLNEEVNLERALKLSDRLGGHIVSGHIDGLAFLSDMYQEGRSQHLIFAAPFELAKYIAPKGSITINGISLTVNKVNQNVFHLNIIPHTLEKTTLKNIKVGDKVNLEIDILARYLERLLEYKDDKLGLDKEKLIALGF